MRRAPAGRRAILERAWLAAVLAWGPFGCEANPETPSSEEDIEMNRDGASFLQEKIVRWTFENGPLAGIPFEHRFHSNGTVEWRAVGGPMEGTSATEERYAAYRLSDDIYAVSYLAASGHTLTAVLDVEALYVVGFASNESEWHPLRGTLAFR